MSGNVPYQPQGYPPQGGTYPPQGFQQPYGGGAQPYASQLLPHRGVVVLVFGILGWTFCGIFGIVAWVMGKNDLAAMRAGTMDRSGESFTTAGYWIGLFAVLANIVGIAFGVLFVMLSAASGW